MASLLIRGLKVLLIGIVIELALLPVLKIDAIKQRLVAEQRRMRIVKLVKINDATWQKYSSWRCREELQCTLDFLLSRLIGKDYYTLAFIVRVRLLPSARDIGSSNAITLRKSENGIGISRRDISYDRVHLFGNARTEIPNSDVTGKEVVTVEFERYGNVDLAVNPYPRTLVSMKGNRGHLPLLVRHIDEVIGQASDYGCCKKGHRTCVLIKPINESGNPISSEYEYAQDQDYGQYLRGSCHRLLDLCSTVAGLIFMGLGMGGIGQAYEDIPSHLQPLLGLSLLLFGFWLLIASIDPLFHFAPSSETLCLWTHVVNHKDGAIPNSAIV
jgi:hypothetical protein